jgi:orotate phosphoribosyltransferase
MGLPAAPPFEAAHRVARTLAGSVVRGNQIQLSSGEVTDWYVDAKPFLYGTENGIAADAITMVLRAAKIVPESFGGVGYGGVPLAVLCGQSFGVPAFAVRAEAKAHGLAGRIAGRLVPGRAVVLLEDVLTTGGSVLSAMTAVEAAGGLVVAILCLLNRSEPRLKTMLAASGANVPVLQVLVPEDIGV